MKNHAAIRETRLPSPARNLAVLKWPPLLFILVALIIVLIREGLPNLPFIDILRVIKYPVGFLVLAMVLPAFFTNLKLLDSSQRVFIGMAFITLANGLISLMLNPETGRTAYWIYLVEWAITTSGIVVLIKTYREVNILFSGLLLIGLLSSLWGMTQNYSILDQVDFSTNLEVGRFRGYGVDPNYFCMLVMIPLAYALTMSSDAKIAIAKRFLYALASTFLIVAIIWTRSRSGSFAIITILILLLYLRGVKSGLGLILLLLLSITIVSAFLGKSELINIYAGLITRWGVITEFSGSRPELWKAALQNIYERPIWGWGPGSLQVMIQNGLYLGVNNTIKPHNAWIVAAIERGILGVASQIMMVLLGFRASLLLLRSTIPCIKTIGIASIISLIGQGIMSLTLGGMPLGIYLISSAVLALNASLSSASFRENL